MQTTFLGESISGDARLVGAKAATLSRLAARYRVPVGFCLDATVHATLGSAIAGDADAIATLRALVETGYTELCHRTGRAGTAVAVRSSAIGEDGGETSFAGQHETILDVRGSEAIVSAVLACWRSADSERAVAYRKQHGITERPLVGVLVQEMVPADAAAIAFSVDPVTGDRDIVAIDCGSGLGEALAAGTVTPDTYAVRKAHLAIVKRTLATARPALSDDQVREVARLAIALEAESGMPVDIECAFAGGTLFLLQSRPITTLTAPSEFTVEWEEPGDAALTWTREDVHMNEGRPVLSADFVIQAPAFGLDRANLVFGPPARVRYLSAHGYLYAARVPQAPAADMPQLEAAALRRRREAARSLGNDWSERYLPAVLAHYEWMKAARIDDRASALAAWDAFWPRINDIWLIHMLIVPPVYTLLEELATRYASLTGRPATDAATFVQGRAETLQDMQQRLHDLAATIRATPAVARALTTVHGLDELAGSTVARPSARRSPRSSTRTATSVRPASTSKARLGPTTRAGSWWSLAGWSAPKETALRRGAPACSRTAMRSRRAPEPTSATDRTSSRSSTSCWRPRDPPARSAKSTTIGSTGCARRTPGGSSSAWPTSSSAAARSRGPTTSSTCISPKCMTRSSRVRIGTIWSRTGAARTSVTAGSARRGTWDRPRSHRSRHHRSGISATASSRPVATFCAASRHRLGAAGARCVW